MPDPSLEALKRVIDLADYARSVGYIDKPRDSIPGIVVLEHERGGDVIAVARCERGGIYARVPDYTPRAPGESEEVTRIRLRDAIMRSSDTGSVVEFVGSRERTAGRPEPDLQRVREHLAAWQEVSRGLRQHPHRTDLGKRVGDWTPSPPSPDRPAGSVVEARLQRWQEAQRLIDRKLVPASELLSPPLASPGGGTVDRSPKPEASRRRYDWSPAPPGELPGHRGPRLRDRGGPDQGRGR